MLLRSPERTLYSRMHQIAFGGLALPRPAGGAHSALRPPCCIREGEEDGNKRGRGGRGGKGTKGQGRGERRERTVSPHEIPGSITVRCVIGVTANYSDHGHHCCACTDSKPLSLCKIEHNPATRFRPPSATVVSAEPFLHGTGTLRCLQKEMATYRH